MNDSLKRKLDAFQLKGLRQILKLQTTYVNRNNTNEHVFAVANSSINTWGNRQKEHGGGFRPKKHIIPISDYYELQRRKLVVAILNEDQDNPITDICINKATLELKSYDERRVGRPRHNWWSFGLKQYWEYVTRTHLQRFYGVEFDSDNNDHIAVIHEAANTRLGCS